MAKGWGALVKWVPSFDDAGAATSPWGPLGGVGPAGPQGNPGPQGAQGPAGPAGAAGPAGLNWKGAWAAGTAYVANDSVGRNGASWFATGAAAAGVDPNPSGDGHTAQAPWQLLAAQGAQGPQGIQGPAGTTGATGAQGPAGGGALTLQHNELGADVIGMAAGAPHNAFTDAFAVGTWDITFQVGVAPVAAGAIVAAAWAAAGTATVAFQGGSGTQLELNVVNAGDCVVVTFKTRAVVTVAGSINLVGFCDAAWTMRKQFNEVVPVQATGYLAEQVA